MDLDSAKENIQPLASGRNIERLVAALNAESQHEVQQEILQQRKQFEHNILTYKGDDPLEPWYAYILWIEQSYPKNGKETALDEVILKCLQLFEAEKKYHQDRRMIKLFIKYIDFQSNPLECYQILYNQGIGTMVADLYICWALYYDMCDSFEKAESIYQKGIDAGSQPIDQLKQAHMNFGFSMSQRMLYKGESYKEQFQKSIEERRLALTSLQNNKHIGSIRTGSAVKSILPGKISQTSAINCMANSNIKIFQENLHISQPDSAHIQPPTTLKSILSNTHKNENLREPGPWSQAKQTNLKKINPLSLKSNPDIGFSILEDTDDDPLPPLKGINMHKKGIQLAPGFVKRNIPQENHSVPLFIEEEIKPNIIPAYDKILLFPNKDKCFSLEELAAYKWFKKRKIQNQFTDIQDKIWSNDYFTKIRLPPQFCSKNDQQTEFIVPHYIEDEIQSDKMFVFDLNKIYPSDSNEQFSFEENLKTKWLNGQLKSQLPSCVLEQSMDETMVVEGRKSICKGAVRKSILCGARKTIIPPMIDETKFSIFDTEYEDREINDNMLVNQISCPTGSKTNEDCITTQKAEIDFRLKTMVTEEKQENNRESVHFHSKESIVSNMSPEYVFKDNIPPILVHKTGAIRKSVYVKRINQHDYKMQNMEPIEDENVTNNVILPSSSQPKSSSKTYFNTVLDNKKQHLYTLNEELPSPLSFKNNENIFKAPTSVDCLKTQKAVNDENDFTVKNNEMDSTVHYLPNDSCSTQTFNFFIKAQSVSTPKANKKAVKPIEQPNIIQNNQEVHITTAPSSGNQLSFITPLATTVIPRQLSTIMETTESNTVSSATASTKSSVSSVSSSPETEFDLSKTHPHVAKSSSPEVFNNVNENAHANGKEYIYVDKSNKMKENVLSNAKLTTNYCIQNENQTENNSNVITATEVNCPFKIYEENTEAMLENLIIKENLLRISTQNVDAAIVCPFNIYEDTTQNISPTSKLPINNFTDKKLSNDDPQKNDKIQNLKESLISSTNKSEDKPENVFIEKTDSIELASLRKNNVKENINSKQNITIKPSVFPTSIENTIPSMCPISIYEDNTEITSKCKLFNNETVEKPLLSVSHFIQQQETIPSICPIDSVIEKAGINNKSDDDYYSLFTQTPIKQHSLFKNNKTQLKCDPNNSFELIIKQETHMETKKSMLLLPDGKNSSIKKSKSRIPVLENCTINRSLNKRDNSINNSQYLLQPLVINIESSNKNEESFATNMSQPLTKHNIGTKLPSPIVKHRSFKKSTPFNNSSTNDFSKQQSMFIKEEFNYTIEEPIYLDEVRNENCVPIPSHVKNTKNDLTDSVKKLHLNELSISDYEMEKLRNLNSLKESNTEQVLTNNLLPINDVIQEVDKEGDEHKDIENSIYVKPNTIEYSFKKHGNWVEIDDSDDMSENKYLHKYVDLDQTTQTIYNHLNDHNLDPFDTNLREAFLEKIYFVDYLSKMQDVCSFVSKIRPLRPNNIVDIGTNKFRVLQLIGEGSFGQVFSAKCQKTNTVFALKQERPPNMWEYYICLELLSRLQNRNILRGFMSVDCSLIGNNASILVSTFSKYGTILNVCNKIKQQTGRNMDEYIVMIITSQMLSIIDHLHSCNIIHADLKPDNFLLMERIAYDNENIVIQLIDYGQAIDLKLFSDGQTFSTSILTKNFACIEMIEKKPWTFQTDLYCLAGTIHAMLLARYMDVVKKINGYTIKAVIPRYYNKLLWERIFTTLINIRDCVAMPNLQIMREILLKEIATNEKLVRDKIIQFNNAIE